MKTFLALVALLSATALVTGTSSALDDNLFGLFYDRAATINDPDVTDNSQQVIYLVLINPVSDFGNVQLVGGFECLIVPATGDFLMGVAFPIDAINVGSNDDLAVGFAQGLQVDASGGTTLATFSVMTMGNNPEGYFLKPPSSPSHPNAMAYLDQSGPEEFIVDAMPVSGSYDRPVFTFGDYTVEEGKMWGDVKSLYR